MFQQAVDDLTIDESGGAPRVTGVVTQIGLVFQADAVVLTTGTFLSGLIHVGLKTTKRDALAIRPPSGSVQSCELQLPVGRLKTGTPPRIDGRTIDFSSLETQPGDVPTPVFSFMGTRELHPRQVPCWITRTARTHDIIRAGLDRSPLFTGDQSVGPRYCPSIEDKVVRFAERDSHQIFLEPEGLTTNEIYPNGISTSLPFDVQLALVRRARLRMPISCGGYSIEYDYFDPRGLKALETKAIAAFLRGTDQRDDGYEEAARRPAGGDAGRLAAGGAAGRPRRGKLSRRARRRSHRGVSEPYRCSRRAPSIVAVARRQRGLAFDGRRLGVVDERAGTRSRASVTPSHASANG
jgi:tRNA uridine 5-carboxymethylaminomethyl modification enzyme